MCVNVLCRGPNTWRRREHESLLLLLLLLQLQSRLLKNISVLILVRFTHFSTSLVHAYTLCNGAAVQQRLLSGRFTSCLIGLWAFLLFCSSTLEHRLRERAFDPETPSHGKSLHSFPLLLSNH